jgi:molybdopterin-guanine dinucleotide biosynthesis protein B
MVPVVSIVGRSDSGKTTLIERLVPILKKRGLKVGTIKHDVHGFQVDYPGKDSWRHKNAGADVTIISSPTQIAMVKDTDHDWSIDELSILLDGLDIVLTEGYKKENRPKIEVFRHQTSDIRPLCSTSDNLIAMVTNENVSIQVPLFHPDEPEALADFLIKYFNLSKADET